MMSGRGRRGRRRSAAGSGRRGVGRVRHLPRRAARGRGARTRRTTSSRSCSASADAGELQFHEDELQAQLASGALPMSDLTGDELLTFLVLLLVAGNETTRNALSGGIDALSRFPDEREQARRRPVAREQRDRGDPALRVAGDQLLAHGHRPTPSCAAATLHEGDVVLNVYPSANRDADVFDDPHAFRVDRVAEPAPRVRYRSALLPRREPRPHRDPHPARGAVHAACPTSRSRRVPAPSARRTRSSRPSSTSRSCSRRTEASGAVDGGRRDGDRGDAVGAVVADLDADARRRRSGGRGPPRSPRTGPMRFGAR